MTRNQHQQLMQALQVAWYAASNSSFYRGRLMPLLADQKWSPERFLMLPLTDQQMLADFSSQMLCQSQSQVARIRTLMTSGSTGSPKRIFFGADDLERTVDFFASGMIPLAPAGLPVFIMMSNDKPDSIARLLQAGLARSGRSGVILGRPTQLPTLLHKLKSGNTLVGMPADLLYLSHLAPQLRPASVLLSADYISPPLIKRIRSQWHCPVFTHYGLTESCYGLAVQDHENGDMLIRQKDFLLEIIDSEIVLTSLHCCVQPLIRYRTGDCGHLSPPGEDGWPRLTAVTGRLQNLKKPVNIHRLDDLLYARTDIAAYEAFWQDETLRLEINGTLPSAKELSAKLGIPVRVQQSTAAPWDYPGKHRLHEFPATTCYGGSESSERQY